MDRDADCVEKKERKEAESQGFLFAREKKKNFRKLPHKSGREHVVVQCFSVELRGGGARGGEMLQMRLKEGG